MTGPSDGTRSANPAAGSGVFGPVFKTDAQRKFCLENDKQIRGRYLAVVETSIGILGGEALRTKARDAVGHAIKPEAMYPVSDWVRLVMVASDGGISPRRLGMLFFPKFKQTHSELFPPHKITYREALGIIEKAARAETNYGGAPYTMTQTAPDKLHVVRTVNPLPCEFFAGVLAGTLDALGYKGTVKESACQWTGDKACEFDAVLASSMGL